MPSNAELIESINTESELKNLDKPNIENVDNKGLLLILKELKAVTPKPPEDDEVIEEKKPPFYIADGKSLTCTKRGVLSEGKEIKPEYLPGGMKRLSELVKAGIVIKS